MKHFLFILTWILLASIWGIFLFASYETKYVPSQVQTGVESPPLSLNTTDSWTASGGENIESGKVIPPKICVENPKVHFFMYHYIRDDDTHDTHGTHELSIPPNLFEKQMEKVHALAASGSVSLMQWTEFLSALKEHCYPGKEIWIFTDDDGWIDTYASLYPIAKKYEVPFFLGIIANRLDKPGFVTRTQVQEISNNPLFTISSHSLTHSDESHMDIDTEIHEMCESKNIIESTIWKSVDTYIYPSGRIGTWSVHNIEVCGYTLAWSTQFGSTFRPDSNKWAQVNRTRIGRETSPEYFEKLLLDNTGTAR